ncbi:MAG: Asp-tRNA(Asn)/Glu-tRNA(Gln) amidotransferase subunit GatB, partial [Fimbriimonadales bacterium]|nr:Asp-tRNA(Asn)/Glu-tRNA(Gln) amidotransferase subunit GatB [Fimbriimonadales bacterium]
VLRTALALNCRVPLRSVFHRKNYFYPDLPKGYQISQYGETNPLGYHGFLEIPLPDGGAKRVGIRRVHLEEDTGKLVHMGPEGSGVDCNRAGVPLMEIVTDFPPDIQTAEEAREYLVQLRLILLYLGVCDGKMEEGSLRCEPNVSVRPAGSDRLGTKTELKNLNSFRSVQLGVEHEIRRHIAILESGGTVPQETRGWNEQTETSFLMRRKEEENDYRYFPDPDLAPMAFTEQEIEQLRAGLPELPLAKRRRYRESLGLSDYDAGLLVADPRWAAFFDEAVAQGGDPKTVCNWMNSDFAKALNASGKTVDQAPVTPAHLVDLCSLVARGRISGKMAKGVFAEAFQSGRMPSQIVEAQGLTQITDESAILELARRVIRENPKPVEQYRAGQANVVGFLIGQLMKACQGRANPQTARKCIEEALNE